MEIIVLIGVLILAIALWPITLWLVIAWACFALHWAIGVIFIGVTLFAMAANA